MWFAVNVIPTVAEAYQLRRDQLRRDQLQQDQLQRDQHQRDQLQRHQLDPQEAQKRQRRLDIGIAGMYILKKH